MLLGIMFLSFIVVVACDRKCGWWEKTILDSNFCNACYFLFFIFF